MDFIFMKNKYRLMPDGSFRSVVDETVFYVTNPSTIQMLQEYLKEKDNAINGKD